MTSCNLTAKESGQKCVCVNNDDFTVLVSEGSRLHVYCEHVYCVAIAFKMTERVEQRICIRFGINLEHSSTEIIQMTQKATAMGNCDWQLHRDNATTHASRLMQFSCKTSNHPGDSAPYSPDLAPCDFWLFPKLKSPLKGKGFQTVIETQENMIGQLMAIGRTV